VLRVIISIDSGSKVLIAAKGNLKHKSGRSLKYIYIYIYIYICVQAGWQGGRADPGFICISFHSWFFAVLARPTKIQKNIPFWGLDSSQVFSPFGLMMLSFRVRL
jgi:hypothetical protein